MLINIYDIVAIVLDIQQEIDGLIELEKGQSRLVITACGFQYSIHYNHYSIGTTKKGIGSAYSAKVGFTVTDTLSEPRLLCRQVGWGSGYVICLLILQYFVLSKILCNSCNYIYKCSSIFNPNFS